MGALQAVSRTGPAPSSTSETHAQAEACTPPASPLKRLKTPEKAPPAMHFSLLSPDLRDWQVSAHRRGAAAPEQYRVNARTLQLEPIAHVGVQRTAGHRRPAGSSAAGLQTGQAGGSSQGQAIQPQQVSQRRKASTKPAHAAGKAMGKARAQVLPICHPHGCTVTCLAASCPIPSGYKLNMQTIGLPCSCPQWLTKASQA